MVCLSDVKNASMESTRIKINTFLIICGGVFLLEWLGHLLYAAGGRSELLVLGGIRSIEIVFIVATVRFIETGTTSIGLTISQICSGMKRGLIWAVGFGCISGIAFLLLHLLARNPLLMIQVQLPPNTIDASLFFLVGGLISPVAEELVFRGVIYSFFRKLGVLSAVLISTFLFVSLHSIGAGLPITQIVGGILFALAFEIEKNLMAPIVIHILGNLSIFTISLLTS
jgi:membrane protease YdiL (CAAX protease family)